MEKHERALITYKRNHRGEHFQESETAKMQREKAAVKKLRKRSDACISRVLAAPEDECALEAYDAVARTAKKTGGNLRTHAARLRELEKNDDFS